MPQGPGAEPSLCVWRFPAGVCSYFLTFQVDRQFGAEIVQAFLMFQRLEVRISHWGRLLFPLNRILLPVCGVRLPNRLCIGVQVSAWAVSATCVSCLLARSSNPCTRRPFCHLSKRASASHLLPHWISFCSPYFLAPGTGPGSILRPRGSTQADIREER